MPSNAFLSALLPKPFALLLFLVACLPLLITLPARAQTFEVLYSFQGPPDAQAPDSVLLLDGSGNISGVTYGGGASYRGTAFRLSTSGKETVLYSFLAGYGSTPNSVIQAAGGTLYGTTTFGGSYGQGSVFRVDVNGSESVLYSFRGADRSFGYDPNGVIRDDQGNLYGTTVTGGLAGGCFGGGCGLVYKLDSAGNQTVLYTFQGGTDGGYPSGPIVRDSAGNLFGVTAYGGDLSCLATRGCGVVFKVDPAGNETVLHTFTGAGGDGAQPWSGLISDEARNLYGSTELGGTGPNCTSDEDGCGTLFKIDPAGTETVLYSFTGIDGDYPPIYATLAVDAKGNLYGTTPNGGSPNCSSGCGSVFMLAPFGKQTMLYQFTGGTEGAIPLAGVTVDSSGNIYGTTASGGDLSCNTGTGCGTVFRITR